VKSHVAYTNRDIKLDRDYEMSLSYLLQKKWNKSYHLKQTTRCFSLMLVKTSMVTTWEFLRYSYRSA